MQLTHPEHTQTCGLKRTVIGAYKNRFHRGLGVEGYGGMAFARSEQECDHYSVLPLSGLPTSAPPRRSPAHLPAPPWCEPHELPQQTPEALRFREVPHPSEVAWSPTKEPCCIHFLWCVTSQQTSGLTRHTSGGQITTNVVSRSSRSQKSKVVSKPKCRQSDAPLEDLRAESASCLSGSGSCAVACLGPWLLPRAPRQTLPCHITFLSSALVQSASSSFL